MIMIKQYLHEAWLEWGSARSKIKDRIENLIKSYRPIHIDIQFINEEAIN